MRGRKIFMPDGRTARTPGENGYSWLQGNQYKSAKKGVTLQAGLT
jgi:hypothetical protein